MIPMITTMNFIIRPAVVSVTGRRKHGLIMSSQITPAMAFNPVDIVLEKQQKHEITNKMKN